MLKTVQLPIQRGKAKYHGITIREYQPALMKGPNCPKHCPKPLASSSTTAHEVSDSYRSCFTDEKIKSQSRDLRKGTQPVSGGAGI